MTREEAIEWFENHMPTKIMPVTKAVYEMALAALRGPTREMVEKVWSGCPECKPRCGLCVYMGAWGRHGKPYVCEQCVDYSNFESDQRFCEVCGAPMTDEAVDMMLERWREALENDTL